MKPDNQGCSSLNLKQEGDQEINVDSQGTYQGQQSGQQQVDNSKMKRENQEIYEDQIAPQYKSSKKTGCGKKIWNFITFVGTLASYGSAIGLILVIPQNQQLNDQISEKDAQINDLYSDIKTIQSKYAEFNDLSQNFTKILSYPNSTPAQILTVIDMEKRIDLLSDQQTQFKAELIPMIEEWNLFKNNPSIIIKSWTEQFTALKNDNAQFKDSTSSEMQKLRDAFTYTVKPLNQTIEQLQVQTLTLQTLQNNTNQALTKTTNDLSTYKTSSNQFQQDQTTINSKLDSFYKFQQNSVEVLSPFYSSVWDNYVTVNGNGYVKLDKFQPMTGTVDSKTLISITFIGLVQITGGGGVWGNISILNNSQSKLKQLGTQNYEFGSSLIISSTSNPISLFFQYIIEKGQSYDFAIGVDADRKNISATVLINGPSVFITKQKIKNP